MPWTRILITAQNQDVTITPSTNMSKDKKSISQILASNKHVVRFSNGSKTLITKACPVHLDDGIIIVEKGATINGIVSKIQFAFIGPEDFNFSDVVIPELKLVGQFINSEQCI